MCFFFAVVGKFKLILLFHAFADIPFYSPYADAYTCSILQRWRLQAVVTASAILDASGVKKSRGAWGKS